MINTRRNSRRRTRRHNRRQTRKNIRRLGGAKEDVREYIRENPMPEGVTTTRVIDFINEGKQVTSYDALKTKALSMDETKFRQLLTLLSADYEDLMVTLAKPLPNVRAPPGLHPAAAVPQTFMVLKETVIEALFPPNDRDKQQNFY